jgi:hypothetical protein
VHEQKHLELFDRIDILDDKLGDVLGKFVSHDPTETGPVRLR